LSTLKPLPRQLGRFIPVTVLSALALTASSYAQVVIPKSPVIGSSNPVTAEPLVPRPSTKPCVVPLFTNQAFADYSAKTFSYTPPADCPGPWAKVVFTADFTVTAGVQFDRTASLYLGHANIFYGTTAEPGSTLSPSWHVERDVTDLSAIFDSAQSGEADIYNIVNSTYTGIIYGNAALEFYPASHKDPAPAVPDVVVPLPDAAGGAAALNTTASQLAQTVTLPTNVERAYLDVIAQSQSDDEFWYTCVPTDVTGPLESCGNTAFRETEISIDGTPAGVAPVYPWIYTGGIDPFLWQPITGVQTLDFKPYRVDLTPFAGLLADGKSHSVALSVFNADSYFLVTANLLAYTDKGANVVTGKLLSDNLTAAPTPTVDETLNLDSSGDGTATVTVTSQRNFTIKGSVHTSHGIVTTTVAQDINFENKQNFTINASAYIQDISQNTVVDSSTTTQSSEGISLVKAQFNYPFTIDINVEVAADGSETQTTTSDQNFIATLIGGQAGELFSFSGEQVISTDTLNFDASGNFTGNTGTKSSANDLEFDSRGHEYYRRLTSKGGVLTGVSNKP
jgi:Peptide N-acetyl-beta-D-glucosaminyl asparaginase amidase A